MTTTLRGISIADRTGRKSTDPETGEVTTEYLTVYLVYSDDKNDGTAIVLATAGLPKVGDLYSAGNDSDQTAIVVEVIPRQRDSPTEWEVDVVAVTDVTIDPSTTFDNPLDKPAEINYGFTNRIAKVEGFYTTPQTPPQNGQFDTTAQSPNGEPLWPAPEIDIDEPVLEIVKCYSLADVPDLTKIQNTVNTVSFQGADARQLKLTAEAQSRWREETWATIGGCGL